MKRLRPIETLIEYSVSGGGPRYAYRRPLSRSRQDQWRPSPERVGIGRAARRRLHPPGSACRLDWPLPGDLDEVALGGAALSAFGHVVQRPASAAGLADDSPGAAP